MNPANSKSKKLFALGIGAAVLACEFAGGRTVLAADSTRSSGDVRREHSVMTYTGTVLANVVYFPAKVVFAGIGAVASGGAYVVTLGDDEPARSIWYTALEGNYVLTPRMIEGREPVRFAAAPRPNEDARRVSLERPARGTPDRSKARARPVSLKVPPARAHDRAKPAAAPRAADARSSAVTKRHTSARIVLHGVRFDPMTGTLRDESLPVLQEAATILRRTPDVEVVIPTRSVLARRDPRIRADRELTVRRYLNEQGSDSVHALTLQFIVPDDVGVGDVSLLEAKAPPGRPIR